MHPYPPASHAVGQPPKPGLVRSLCRLHMDSTPSNTTKSTRSHAAGGPVRALPRDPSSTAGPAISVVTVPAPPGPPTPEGSQTSPGGRGRSGPASPGSDRGGYSWSTDVSREPTQAPSVLSVSLAWDLSALPDPTPCPSCWYEGDARPRPASGSPFGSLRQRQGHGQSFRQTSGTLQAQKAQPQEV